MIWLSFIIIIATTINADDSVDYEAYWQQFLQDYNPKYKDAEEREYRKLIFIKNVREILKHNEEYKAGLHSYFQAINQFADKTDKELKSSSLGLRGSGLKSSLHRKRKNELRFNPNIKVPDFVDWRERGAVTPVQDQGECFSCWAFSAIGAIEGQYFLATNKSIVLSKQQLVDCSFRNEGCTGGGLMREAFEDIDGMGGVEPEEAYPYRGWDQACQFKVEMAVVDVVGYVPIEEDENALKQAVALHGPISIGVEVTDSFQRYGGSVLHIPDCSNDPSNMNHGVLLVGYGTEDGKDYWLIKNSWGVGWGLNGYIKMSRNRGNNCNVATYATYPLVVPAVA